MGNKIKKKSFRKWTKLVKKMDKLEEMGKKNKKK